MTHRARTNKFPVAVTVWKARAYLTPVPRSTYRRRLVSQITKHIRRTSKILVDSLRGRIKSGDFELVKKTRSGDSSGCGSTRKYSSLDILYLPVTCRCNKSYKDSRPLGRYSAISLVVRVSLSGIHF